MQAAEIVMTERVIGEIREFGPGAAPAGWLQCDGRLLLISEHQPLFSVVGWRYGGDGWTTFALPDLRTHGGEVAGAVPCIAATGIILEAPPP